MKTLAVSLLFVGLLSSALAQEVFEVAPSVENRSHDPDIVPNSTLADAFDGAVASSNGAGASSAPGLQIISSEVGYNFSLGSPDFGYGEEITPPLEDLAGGILTLAQARAYWRQEPAKPGETIQVKNSTTGQPDTETPVAANSSNRFHYSPHKEQVIASQTGSTTVVWVTATPDGDGNLQTFRKSYSIGFTTDLVTRPIYWTEVDHKAPRVQIPTGIVQGVTILYNDAVPATVAPGDRVIPANVDEQLVPDATVWYDSNLEMLRAYNREGKVLIEYLGDPRDPNDSSVRQHLGLEIIDVRKEAAPVIVETVIGEQLLPSDTPDTILDDRDFSPIQVSQPGSPVAQHFVENRTVYFSIAENLQAPNVEFYWLGEGTHTILWPEIRNYYRMQWPNDVGGFEGVFARPDLGSEGDLFSETQLNLLSTNSPELIHQDDPSALEATMDFQFNLSVAFGSSGDGVNRSLIRFNSGNAFWYIRLYSATVSHLKSIDAAGTAFNPSNPFDFHLARSVVVGQRLEPPHESLALGGYIDPDSGDAYQPLAYVDPFAEGGIEGANGGAIIPVNALPGNDQLRVWWFRKLSPRTSQADLFQPIHIPVVIGDYTITYPSNAPQIVMASNAGTGDLAAEQVGGEIYFQNDPSQPGYNPNEEHALMIAGRGYALRDDINVPNISSEPFVLISHDDAEGRPDMSVFEVLRENAEYTFDYPAVAGRLLQAPLPLPVIPQPLMTSGGVTTSKNEEVTPPALDPVMNGSAAQNLTHYNEFTFEDRKGDTWVYRGQHDGDSGKKISMRYYYPTLEGFAFPNATSGIDEAPELGTIVPYLRPLGATDNPVSGTPLTITFTPQWPEETPVLHFGETLAKPKFGLPQIMGQSSVQLLYQQSIAQDFTAAIPSVVLHDSTINRTAELASAAGLDQIPGTVLTTDSRGKTYFQGLPSHLQERLFFDPLTGTKGALVFQGQFNDEPVGEDYLLNNTFSPADVASVKALCLSADPDKEKWDLLVDSLKIIPNFRRLDNRLLETRLSHQGWLTEQGITTVIGQTSKDSFGPTDLPEIVDPDQVVNDFFLSAIGGGEGYVSIATGNGRLNTEEGEPVEVHIFRVGEKLYRGELKPLVAANPLSENVTVQHTGDFAAKPEGYEFEWRKAPPVDGLAPAISIIDNRTLGGALANVRKSRTVSVTAGTAVWDTGAPTAHPFADSIHPAGSDRTAPGLRVTGDLDFTTALGGDALEKAFFSLNFEPGDGAIVSLNGVEVIRHEALTGNNSETAPSIPSDLQAFLTNGGDFVVFEVPARSFVSGSNKVEVLFNTERPDDAMTLIDFRVAIQAAEDRSSNYFLISSEAGKNHHVISGAGIDTLGDNYYIMRYKPLPGHPQAGQWSTWTRPVLVEGWIKRVLAGINPFNQRVTDFFENAVDTNVSIISQAGSRWEGDIALTLDAVQDAGLIEIYETVLKRGIDLSIDGTPAVDYAPANDALLLAAGYLNDLYVALGNEAFADAANPTVHFDSQVLGTIGNPTLVAGFEETFRSTSTARFAFQGQVPTLIDEELALLRGRDDFLSPSVEISPVYNRLFWNYTRGIDAGELVYALNYNIREESDAVADGKIDAADAARMFPQAHGDAYGHYLTAVKNYYRLLTDPEFTWGTRIEAVNVLGQPVSIDYFDERKFAASAASVATTANQVISLQRRKAFQSSAEGWENLTDARENDRTGTTRHWGVDDWAARGSQGAYFNWVVGNAILPEEDTVHEGIQKIDRTTVPELDLIAKSAEQIQKQLEAADARVNPLNLAEDSLLFDISPTELEAGKTHFEQIYERAVTALSNANAVFERAADSTRLLRSLENQSQNLTQAIADEELAFITQLYDIYGEPYRGDVGAGKIYPQGYTGPDFIRFMLIDRPFEIYSRDQLFAYGPDGTQSFTVNYRDNGVINSLDFSTTLEGRFDITNVINTDTAITYTLREGTGPYMIADASLGQRPALGALQFALHEVRYAEEQLYAGMLAMERDRSTANRKLGFLIAEMNEHTAKLVSNETFKTAEFIYKKLVVAIEALQKSTALFKEARDEIASAAVISLPNIIGLSNDLLAPVRAAILTAKVASGAPVTAGEVASHQAKTVANLVFLSTEKALEVAHLGIDEAAYIRGKIEEAKNLFKESTNKTREVDALAVAHTRAMENYRTEIINGEVALANREVFRRRAAGTIQGYRTRDVAFRTFRSEALEEYQTLLDWASRYAYLAAQAYDYETGLLSTPDGQAFLGDIISSRALGVVSDDGQPMLSASSTGDAGLSGLLAKLKADYDVVKGRLGFNNPEANGTTLSLRRELFRIDEGPAGDVAWQQKLESLVTADLLTDPDMAIHAMQLSGADAVAQPGILISFPSTIEVGKNFFGKELMAGDSDFSTTNFATKISSLGVVFEGYHGMAPCPICLQADHGDALSATPNVFLIPVGLDTMRTPPLGDGTTTREWHVHDYAMPLPFDLGSVEPTAEAVQQVSAGLRVNYRSPRRHPSFRATDIPDYFYTSLASDYTSSRLVGRSVWNSNWKLAIPAKELLADETEGIARFIRSVKDIKLHLKTYSYAGN